ncbi:MAG: hypothetical protein ACQUYJ_10905 [Ferruginibacter sp.]
MQQRINLPALCFTVLIFCVVTATAQKINSKVLVQPPNLILKVSYQNQLLAKVRSIQKNGNFGKKLTKPKISAEVLKNINNAAGFIALYEAKNGVIAPMFLPSPYRTYLRIGHYPSGISPLKDQVVSAFFNETEQSFLVADKDFTNQARINSLVSKDVAASWEIEASGNGKFTISTTGTKKYLSVKRTGGAGTEIINLTTDKNDLSTNWFIYNGADDGISFYNPSFNIFLGRKVAGRKIFLVPLSYKDYGNDALRKTIIISWDLYSQFTGNGGPCYQKEFTHSMRYVLATPAVADADGDGHDNLVCGGNDCDDNDGAKFAGNAEFCDFEGHDEDCNTRTYGSHDNDGDGYDDQNCINIENGVITSSGTDCDDSNAAIYPGQQIFINETTVDVCGLGLFTVAQGYIAVKQPNGTAIVVPKK